MLRTIRGERVEITQAVLEKVRKICDAPKGATYDDIFQILSKEAGITVDEERAIELFKMHFVNDILSVIGGKGETKEIFSGLTEDGVRKNWSVLVMPIPLLDKIIGSYEKHKQKLEGRIERLSKRIVELKALRNNKTLDLDDGINPEEITLPKKLRIG